MIEKILEWLEEEKAKGHYDFNSVIGEKNVWQKAIEIVQEVAKEYGNANDNDLTVVSALPSLYPLQKFEEEAIHRVVASAKDGGWIPCSERLPEIWEDTLLWCKGYFVCGTHIGEECQCYGIGYRLPGNDWEIETLKALNEDNISLLAWKPIAPYQKGE